MQVRRARQGCKNVTQYNTRLRPARLRILPFAFTAHRSLSARKIRLSGISRASPLGIRKLHGELATASKLILRTVPRKDFRKRKTREWFFFFPFLEETRCWIPRREISQLRTNARSLRPYSRIHTFDVSQYELFIVGLSISACSLVYFDSINGQLCIIPDICRIAS